MSDRAPRAAAPGPCAEELRTRLEQVRSRIEAAGRDPGDVRIVAVTKGFGSAEARAALACGIAELGENYASELLDKAAAVVSSEQAGAACEADGAAGARPRWHFLGSIQRNKVARLAPVVACWQGVDRLEEGETIARHAGGAEVLVEVECSGLPGRAGVAPSAAAELVAGLRELGLDVAGLMTVAPPGGGAPARAAFERVAGLVAELGLRTASMGMSDDLEEALAAGSTMIRIGRGLFGRRPGSPYLSRTDVPE